MIPIFDNGHGGMINGEYQTPGKRSPEWEQGILFEGMFNRWVVNRLIEKMDREGLAYYHASPEITDTHLGTRVFVANNIYSRNKKTYFLSIHANAGGGKGIEGFTSPGTTKSDIIAELMLKNLEEDLEGSQVMRFDLSDGDRDKESRFKVLTGTNCPSFLLECGFMDNKEDYFKLWDECYLQNIVNSIFRTIKELYKL